VADGDYVNAVAVLTIHGNLNLQEAIDHICQLLHDAESQFFARSSALVERFPRFEAILRPYLAALGHYMSGLLHWARITTRYHGPGYVWNGLTSGVMTLG
jgi:hypothetical protein